MIGVHKSADLRYKLGKYRFTLHNELDYFLFCKILQYNLFPGNVILCEDLCHNNIPYKNV
jgi:hypothetical protein